MSSPDLCGNRILTKEMFGLGLMTSLMMAVVRLAVLAIEITVRLSFAVLRALTGFRWRFPRLYLPRIFPRTPSAARLVLGVLAVAGVLALATVAVYAALIVGAVVLVVVVAAALAGGTASVARRAPSLAGRASALPGDPAVAERSELPSWFWQAVLVVAIAVGFGAGGYAIGASGGPSLSRARAAGAAEGRASVGSQGVSTGYSEGFREGRSVGDHEAYGRAFHAAYATARRAQ